MDGEEGRLINISDTSLYVVERGRGYPLIVLHGGPGLDHHMFGDYLDALTDDYRLILVDQRANGRSGRPPEETWTLVQNAADVGLLAKAMGWTHTPCWVTRMVSSPGCPGGRGAPFAGA